VRKFLLLASIASLLTAADSSVDGPILGYVNSASGVRSVLGLVGSARLSTPVTGELLGAVILPGSASAIAKNPSGALVRVGLKDGSIASLGVENVTDFAISPAGTTVLARSGDRLHVVSARGDAKKDYTLPGDPTAMAVSDEGTAMALVVRETDGDALYVVNADGARRVFRADGIVALAFMPESRDAVFADNRGTIYRLKSDLQFLEVGVVEGVKALGATADGRVLAVAGKSISALPLDGSLALTVECSCDAVLARSLGESKFLLTSPDDGPMWMVDASARELRVAFIPEAVNE
jgi:hypothetical protein